MYGESLALERKFKRKEEEERGAGMRGSGEMERRRSEEDGQVLVRDNGRGAYPGKVRSASATMDRGAARTGLGLSPASGSGAIAMGARRRSRAGSQNQGQTDVIVEEGVVSLNDNPSRGAEGVYGKLPSTPSPRGHKMRRPHTAGGTPSTPSSRFLFLSCILRIPCLI